MFWPKKVSFLFANTKQHIGKVSKAWGSFVICFAQGIAVILVKFHFQRKEMWYLNEIQVMLFSLGYLVYGNL